MSIFLQYFLAPAITGLIIFIAQFFLLPRLEKNKVAQTELWKEKKDTFIKSIQLIDEKYLSLDFRGHTAKKAFANKETEINNLYTKLLILSENQKIPGKFWKFFDNSIKEHTPAERGEFILIVQKELGLKNETKPEEIPFIFK